MGIKVFRNSVIQYISALNIFLDLKVTLAKLVLIATLPFSWMIKIHLSFYSYFMALFIELGMLDILIIFVLFLREFFDLLEVVNNAKIKAAQLSVISKTDLIIFIFLPFRLFANHFLPQGLEVPQPRVTVYALMGIFSDGRIKNILDLGRGDGNRWNPGTVIVNDILFFVNMSFITVNAQLILWLNDYDFWNWFFFNIHLLILL